ncbi:MAG: 50S ribosomal protein L4, partial [bacterium]|nr:50S ribosomal protein L4 [bacterium]
SRKLKDGEIVFVDSFGMSVPKTALAKKSLDSLAAVSGLEKITTKRRNAALIALSDGSEATKKSFRNIGSVACVPVRDLNPVSVLGSSFIIIENPEAGIAFLKNRALSKKAKADLAKK